MSAAVVRKDLMNCRLAEWLTSLVTIAVAITLSLPGDTLWASPAFQMFIQLGITEAKLAVPTAMLGTARAVALYVNGQWHRTPSIRMVGGMLGAAMFAFLAVGLATPYLNGTSPAPTLLASICLVLAAFDVLAAYRSSHDAKLLRG